MKVPCKNCPDRNPGCHDHCPTYLEFNEQQKKIRKKRYGVNDTYYMDRDMRRSRVNKR